VRETGCCYFLPNLPGAFCLPLSAGMMAKGEGAGVAFFDLSAFGFFFSRLFRCWPLAMVTSLLSYESSRELSVAELSRCVRFDRHEGAS
jgi:hypothetical protein